MKISDFLEHHGIERNPFAEEDAQTDPVFKEHCIDSTFHPTWDKVYGDPREPATSIVLGEKGSGKTAMRLQVARNLHLHNQAHPENRVFVIHYDDFNPFLDRFSDRLGPRKRGRADRVLAEWKLWDHMDALLSLGVTGLVDRLLEVRRPSQLTEGDIEPEAVDKLDRHQARDLLLLAACYDQSLAETFPGRWSRLKRRLSFSTIGASWDFIGACLSTVVLVGLLILLLTRLTLETLQPYGVPLLVAYLTLAAISWGPWLVRWLRRHWMARRIVKRMRTGNRQVVELRSALLQFTRSELAGQPLPDKERTDDRYELLLKFQGILESLGHQGIVVLVDRLDEPHLINGSAELMKALLWPMLDNKFLKHPGLGLKLMLPIELNRFIDREDRDFYQRARLDKQNLIPSFEWTPEALYDVANARLRACSSNDRDPTLRELIDESVTEQRLLEAFRSLRVPRRLFKFLYRLLVNHCNAHTVQRPQWVISSAMFESTLAVDVRDQDAFDRGLGAGG